MKKILALLLSIMMVLAVTGCGSDKEEKELNIAYFDNITHGQALVMKSEKSLEKALGDDTKVNWIAFNAGPAEVEACFSGDVDMGYIGPVPAVTANVKSNGDFVIITAATNGGAVLIARNDSNIDSIKDLSGKTVAIPQLGNTQHLLLLELLKDNKLSTVSEGGDVNVIASKNADIANLINSKDVDAALVPEPWGSTILNNTESKIVMDYDEFQNGEDYSTALVIVNKEYMKENKEIVKKFLQAHIDATDYIVQNPGEACKIMNAQLDEDTGKSLDENIILEAIKRIKFTYDIPEGSIMDYAKISKEESFINELPKEDVFDSSLLDELTK